MAYLRWNLALLADRLAATLANAEAALAQEQAVRGLDALDERALQCILGEGLCHHHQVVREVHYPSSAGRKFTHRPRCDLVLTPAGTELASAPEEALWLEVKVACQLSELGGRHRGYTRRWQAVVTDLRKMTDEVAIRESAQVLVVFTETETVLAKDLGSFENLLVREGVLAGFRHVRTVPIIDRIGHRFCSVAIWPTRMRGG